MSPATRDVTIRVKVDLDFSDGSAKLRDIAQRLIALADDLDGILLNGATVAEDTREDRWRDATT